MIEKFSRHDFLNYKSTIIDLLQIIRFIDVNKAERIYRSIQREIHWYQDFTYFHFDENRLRGALFARENKELDEIGRTMEIKYLCVQKEFHDQGVASKLMDFLFSAVKFNFSNIYLTCHEENDHAINFYGKFGFKSYEIKGSQQKIIKDENTGDEHIDLGFIKRMPLKNVLIRPLRSFETDFLKEMVFISLFRDNSIERSVLEKPEIKKYYIAWDIKKDIGFVARYEDENIGLIWCRFFPFYDQGFGYVDDGIPEMGIAIKEKYRNRGLGQKLLEHLTNRLKHQNVKAVSLSVHEKNPSKSLYERNGFVVFKHEKNAITMLKKLDGS